MRIFGSSATICVLLTFGAETARACAFYGSLDLNDALYADIVVVGEVSNYRVELESIPGIGGQVPVDHFDVLVEQVLKGEAPGTMSVALVDQGQGASPELTTGMQLMALRISQSASPRAPNSVWGRLIPISEVVSHYSVMQEPCHPPFLFDAAHAVSVMRALKIHE